MTYPTLSNDLIHKNSQVEGEKCGIEQVLKVYCMSVVVVVVVVGFNSLNLNALFIEDTVEVENNTGDKKNQYLY